MLKWLGRLVALLSFKSWKNKPTSWVAGRAELVGDRLHLTGSGVHEGMDWVLESSEVWIATFDWAPNDPWGATIDGVWLITTIFERTHFFCYGYAGFDDLVSFILGLPGVDKKHYETMFAAEEDNSVFRYQRSDHAGASVDPELTRTLAAIHQTARDNLDLP